MYIICTTCGVVYPDDLPKRHICVKTPPTPNDALDAARWRALIGCARIRVMGSARLGTHAGHIGVEFWGEHPAKDCPNGPAYFTAFVDGLLQPPEPA